MPAGAVEDENRMGAGPDMAADLGEVPVHGLGVGIGQHQGCASRSLGADRAKEVGPSIAPVARRSGPAATAGPDPGQGALLADTGLILEPDLDRLAAGVLG